jgi:eukaryotic-like serine/threonine-protein kinase
MHTSEQLNVTLAGRYQVDRQIGQGGMATVFLARDLRHHRSVALKVLSSELTAVVGRERFLAEIEVTANLHHPHLLPLFDSGEIDGLLFYVMPFIQGESLRARLARERQLSIEDAVHITVAVGSALDYAHRHGVIHRDLKPENILMHERDPLVMDFGIALALSKAAGARVTQAGISLGTPQYMSPEQATGDRQVDARSDIYSLGAVAYEMIAGEPPHTGSSVQAIMGKVIAERPRSLQDLRETVPEQVDAAIMRALAKLPADRFHSAADFVAAITGAKSLAVTGVRPRYMAVAGEVRNLPITPPAEPLVRRRTIGIAAAATLIAVLGGAIGARAYYKEAPAPTARFVIPLPDSVDFNDTQYRQVALSRDGSRAVFHFSLNYPGQLLTRRTGQMHFDAIPGTDSARSMVISPNGKEILYWHASGPNEEPPVRLMRIPIDGGVAVKIADSASATGQATWGDNDQVIFRRADYLVMVSASGGPERVLARPDTGKNEFALGWPEMLPGSKAALISILHGRSPAPDSLHIGVVDVASGTVTDLGVQGITPHFAGGHILYARTDGELLARPFNAKKLVFTGEARVIAKNLSVRGSHGPPHTRGFTDLAVSQTGMIMFSDGGPFQLAGGASGATRSIVYRRGPDHAAPGWLPTPRLNFQDLRGSPDGTMLAMTIQDTLVAARTNIFTYDFGSGQLRQITRDGMSSRPVWSLDGKRLVYRVTNPAAKIVRQFFSVPWNESEPPTPFGAADGAESMELPRQGGKYIAIVRGDSGIGDRSTTNSDIFIAPIDSPTVERPLAATGIRERMPRFSPDGKWLAYVGYQLVSTSGGSGTSAGVVYARPVPGPGGVTQVSLAEGAVPLWAPDGKAIYYFNGAGAAPLMRAEVSAGVNELRVTSTKEQFGRPGPGTGFGQPTASVTTDLMSNDVILYTTANVPSVAMAPLTLSGPAPANVTTTTAGAAAEQAAMLPTFGVGAAYRPNLVAIVNWQSAAAKPRTPR